MQIHFNPITRNKFINSLQSRAQCVIKIVYYYKPTRKRTSLNL